MGEHQQTGRRAQKVRSGQSLLLSHPASPPCPEHHAEKCERCSDDIMHHFLDLDTDSALRPERPKS
ncbi:hypothetical protein ELI38_21025 [Rhizobium leguminosarum]|nr:hypothetical protein [Rhizobium leguminosarum bv. viciae]TAU98279.1 hypothetical protein ELI38_21025 [Rhizobium leguminosarum]NKK92129.1 hypothetical protein [Rhizobium leguminosarum bv. viciae]TAW53911.1 hypothetical protein ELI14_22720 [Rhizobium leguminosarum]TAX52825.1 hypothetical protein ELH99_22910 [Rhizobium leguminosarum]